MNLVRGKVRMFSEFTSYSAFVKDIYMQKTVSKVYDIIGLVLASNWQSSHIQPCLLLKGCWYINGYFRQLGNQFPDYNIYQ